MNRVIRKFNQNRKTILLSIFIIIAIIIAIQFVNSIIKQQKKNEVIDINQIQENNKKFQERKSVLTDETITEKTSESNIKIISDFIQLCNQKKVSEAYQLISEECKQELFPTQQDFIDNYYSKIFSTEKEFEYENWMSKENIHIYKIKLYENNLMSTGGQDTTYIEEYYTVVDNKDKKSLNINNFINKIQTNYEEKNENISINVKEKISFLEYEIYTIQVKNLTIHDILLDSKESTKTMYVMDENENKYPSYSHEISQNKLSLRAGETRTLKIKYTKQYTSTLTTKKIIFSDIILNYNKYKEMVNKKDYKDREEIIIETN